MANPHDDIAALVQAYCDLVAAGDLDGMATLFEHGAVSGDAHPDPARGRAEVLALYRATLAGDGTPRRLRVSTTDLTVEVDPGGATAVAQSHFTVRAPGQALDDEPLMIGRYNDRFGQIDGRWRFVHRHVHLDVTNADAVRRAGVDLG